MTRRDEVLAWAKKVLANKLQSPERVLDLRVGATAEQAQAAFHKLAKLGHPDLHRNTLSTDELELVTSAYAIAAGAYQTFRSRPTGGATEEPLPTRVTPRPDSDPVRPSPLSATPAAGTPALQTSHVPITPSGPAPSGGATAQMAPRAIPYFRKAEIALRRGDLKGALLQLKLAIAADPQSPLLRTALAELESELRKGP